MKKSIIVLLFLLQSWALMAQSQTVNDQVSSLQLKSSPAYVMLGVEPENIQRPNSPSEFLAGVQSAIVNEKLQPNFAMETTPYYWGKKKPDSKRFNAADFLFSNNFGDNLLRSLTFSFATSESDSTIFGKLKPGTGIGAGLHMQLVPGKPSRKTRERLYEWYTAHHMENILNQVIQVLEADKEIENTDAWLDEVMNIGSSKDIPHGEKQIMADMLMKLLGKKTITPADLPEIQEKQNKISENSENALAAVNEYKFPLTREGFMLELAFANACVAPGNVWNDWVNAKTSLWITPSFRFNINKDKEMADFIDIMAVARCTFNSSKVDTTDYVDVGGKLQWIHNRISFSFEGIYRSLSKKPANLQKGHTFRSAFVLGYKVNDIITFQASFGTNFDGNSTTYSDPKKMFAVAGFNFGFSNLFKNSGAQ
ncbi:MAG: hypothetical protein QM687_14200 [Ferruginibacter sp.]